MARGSFITIEGIDGAGKSTLVTFLAERFRAVGREVVETREPGGSPGAEAIRRLLMDGEADRWSAETEILLFTAARRDHVEKVITPALDRGAVVLCDRYLDSTRAYQGAGDQVRRHLIDALHRLAIGLDPELTLVLDLDPGLAAHRLGARPVEDEDRFERRGIAFQEALREEFLRIAEAEPERCVVIAADAPPAAVAEAAWAAIARRLRIEG